MFAPTHSKIHNPGTGWVGHNKDCLSDTSWLAESQTCRRRADRRTDRRSNRLFYSRARYSVRYTTHVIENVAPPFFCGLAFVSLAPLHLLELEALCRFRDNGTVCGARRLHIPPTKVFTPARPSPFLDAQKDWEHIPTDGRSRSMQHGKPLHSRLPSLECGSCTARGQALCDLRVHTPDIPQAHGSSLSTSTCPCCNTCARRFWSTGVAPQLCETMRL